MDPCQGSSSRSSTTGAGRDNKHKEVMREQTAVGAMAEAPSYCLFPEETGPNSGSLQLHEFFSAARPQPKPLEILEHGPRSCKRELISRLIGHVLPLSCDMYGCRVIQNALDVGEHNQKVVIAKELKNKVHKCVREQFACHVIQKCVECLPPKHIQFIFRSFCGKAKALSIHPSGSRVIQYSQKVLTYSDNPEVYQTLTAEIIEFANKLSAHAFGNYVVQHLLEHGGQDERSMIVTKFDRRMVSMCYHKFASKVLEKSLVFGSQEDRQLIINEILRNAGSQHLDHLVDMMIHRHGNFIIQKMVVMAEEHQVGLLLDVARKNADNLKRYPHGRHLIAAMEKFLSAKEGRPVLLVPPL